MNPNQQAALADGFWRVSHRADTTALPLADRHYNRQKIGSPQFVPPGRCFVLLARDRSALWVTSWPFAQYVKHAWAGAWVNSLFRYERREVGPLASELIIEAVALTRGFYGNAPEPHGIITFIDTVKTHRKRDPGRCYRKAGWRVYGESKAGLLCLGQPPSEMPEARKPYTNQLEMQWTD